MSLRPKERHAEAEMPAGKPAGSHGSHARAIRSQTHAAAVSSAGRVTPRRLSAQKSDTAHSSGAYHRCCGFAADRYLQGWGGDRVSLCGY